MRRTAPLAAAILFLHALNAQAADPKLVAVLPLNAPKLDSDLRSTLEEHIRTAAGDYLRGYGYRVLTSETTLQYVEDNGLDTAKVCEATCALKAARELKATLFISGSATLVEGEYVAFVRLFETKTQQQLGSVKLEGATMKALRKEFEGRAESLFQSVIAGQAPEGSGMAPVPNGDTPSGPKLHSGAVTEAFGKLTITAKPKDSVRIDVEDPDGKKSSSGTPYENPKAKPGRWKIHVSASGFAPEDRSVTVPPDDVTFVKVDLKPLGSLSVTGTPEGAAVHVSGPDGFQDDGGLPWEATGLKTGTYTVEVTRAGYRDRKETADVAPGENAKVEIKLRQKQQSRGESDDEEERSRVRLETVMVGAAAGILSYGPESLAKVQGEASAFVELAHHFAIIPVVALGGGWVNFKGNQSVVNYSAGARFVGMMGKIPLHAGAIADGWTRNYADPDGAKRTTLSLQGELGILLPIMPFFIDVSGRLGYALTPGGTQSGFTWGGVLGVGLLLGKN